ncbi:uncharacterized protein [Halyomorpha halys]|uniref:uncharacterized protein n=1 Tax=Halyomorpha halys TaxID=286706 RepID=UPI0006D4F71E|nr:uncharacterized protein LOC106681858 [Halyomorpha halys]
MMIVYHRRATIFAGIFTVVQGAFWSFITVYSIGVYGCTFDFPFEDTTQTTVMDLFYYSYFYGECRYPDLGPVQNLKQIINPHPKSTYILMIVYGILSAVWIPSSILILVVAVNKIHGKRGSRCYWPWIVTTGMLNLLDVAASIIYIVDITRTLTTKDYAHYFHYDYSLKGVDGLTVLPAVMMTLLSCRVVIIWLINWILFGVVIQASRALRRLSPAAAFVESDARMTPTAGYGKTSSWVHIRKNPTNPGLNPQEINLPRLSPQISERKLDRPTMLPLDGPPRPHRPVLRPLAMGPPSSPPPPPPSGGNSFMSNSPPPIVVPSPSSPFYDVYGKPTTPDSPQPSFVRTRNPLFDLAGKTEGINNNMPWSYMNPNQQQSRKAVPDPDYTIHPKRSSPPSTIIPSEESDTSSLPKRSEGVNNNVPWSYMGSQQPPRPLPEPDYTVRQKRSPPRSIAASEEGDIFSPTRRYSNNPNVWKVM